MAAAGFHSNFSGSIKPYNRKYNVLSASLNKTFPSFLETCGILLFILFCSFDFVCFCVCVCGGGGGGGGCKSFSCFLKL